MAEVVLQQELAEARRERQRLAGQLRMTERLYETLVETVPAITYVLAPESSAAPVFVSRQFEDVLGHPRDAWLGDPAFRFDLVHRDDRKRVESEFSRFLEELDGLHLEYRAVAADGATRWLRETAKVFVPDDGSGTLIQGIILDISGLRDAQYELEQKGRELQLILDSVPAAISFRDLLGRLIFINQAFARLLGQEPGALVGHDLLEIFPEHGDEVLAQDRKALDALETTRGVEEELDTPAGSRWVRTDRIPYRDEDGTTHGLITFSIDESEKRDLEQQLRQAQKMEAIGRVAGGVAHDFNNLLTVIQGNAEWLEDLSANNGEAQQGVSQIQKAVARASALTGQLLAFSRKQVLQPQVIDLAELTADMHKMLERLLGDSIELAFESDADLVTVKADPNQFQQVLMNLVVNARDAMPEGGTIVVELRNLTLTESLSGPEGLIPSGDYAELRVVDTGIGMDEETRSRIFEPFYSTKGPGRGTGLGLATVYGIVIQSRGHILVESSPGQGSTFRILLPRVDEPAARVSQPEDVSLEDVTGTERVLVVEDDAEIRDFLCRALRTLGYDVAVAEHGTAAVALYERGFVPDVVVTDIEMPHMSGIELAQWIRGREPGFPVVFTSGYTSQDDGIEPESGPSTAFIAKPFQPSQVALAIRQVLAAAAELCYNTQPQL